MLRPERMTFTSIICVRKDVESVLEALSSFGEFHIEQASEDSNITGIHSEYPESEESLSNVNS